MDDLESDFLKKLVEIIDTQELPKKTDDDILDLLLRQTDSYMHGTQENIEMIVHRLGLLEHLLGNKKSHLRAKAIEEFCSLVQHTLHFPYGNIWTEVPFKDAYLFVWTHSRNLLELLRGRDRAKILEHFPFSNIADSDFWSGYQEAMLRIKKGEVVLTNGVKKEHRYESDKKEALEAELKAREEFYISCEMIPELLDFQKDVEDVLAELDLKEQLAEVTEKGEADYRRLLFQDLEEVPKVLLDRPKEKKAIEGEKPEPVIDLVVARRRLEKTNQIFERAAPALSGERR